MGNFKRKDWEKLASGLSGENAGSREFKEDLLSGDTHEIIEKWKGLREMSDEKEINVDKAWDKLSARLRENGSFDEVTSTGVVFFRSTFFKIAAAILVLIALGGAAIYLGSEGLLSRKINVATGDDRKNESVTLPDGSIVILNRNTRLAYRPDFGKSGRNVSLTGEAFFKITPDKEKPFVIDAGKAKVKVLGTTFNVITNNTDSAVEVYVETGRVMLSDNSSPQGMVLDPGYVGTINAGHSVRKLNSDPNYMAWNSGRLVYNGQSLDVVFRDLKKVYNMDIVADNPAILTETWTTPIDNQAPETIIRLICTSFNLSYYRDGDVFHLVKR